MNSVAEIIKKKSSSPSVVVASVLLGVAFGTWRPNMAVATVVFSDIYVDLLKLISIPFMISSVVYSLSQLIGGHDTQGILGRVAKLLVFSMIGCALLGLFAAAVMGPGRNLSEDTMMTLGRMTGQNMGEVEIPLYTSLTESSSLSIKAMILGIIPSNIFTALTNGDTLKILIFSLLFGLVVGRMKPEVSKPLNDVLNSVFNACLKLTIWLNLLVPLVLVSMVAYQVATSGLAPLRAMLGFLMTFGATGIIVIAVSLFLLRLSTGLPWHEVLSSQRESLIMAVATRSAPACMPTMINTLAGRIGLPKERIELMVPLGVSVLRIASVLYYTTATLFIAQMYGKDLHAMEWFAVAFGAVLAGFASSGMTGIVTISLTGIVCSYIGLPFASLLVLFVAIEPLGSTIRTVITVMGTNAFAAISCEGTSKPVEVEAGALAVVHEGA